MDTTNWGDWAEPRLLEAVNDARSHGEDHVLFACPDTADLDSIRGRAARHSLTITVLGTPWPDENIIMLLVRAETTGGT